MPPFLWAFFIAIGAAGGSALLGPPAIWAPVDTTARSAGRLDGEVGYYLQTNYPWNALADREQKTCTITVIAWTTGPRVRLQLGGEEQLLDTAWTKDYVVPVDFRITVKATFLNPVGGAVLATRETAVNCLGGVGAPARDPMLYDSRGLRGYEPVCPPCKEAEDVPKDQ